MRALSTAANYSVLWGAIAAVLAMRRGKGRTAAIEGVVGIGVTSAVVNQGVKRVAERRRPERVAADVPVGRHVRMPRSTSFPSGHSASAFAFASAAGDVMPMLAPPLYTLAAVVAYSRVHTGVHYPADILVGSLVGLIAGNTVSASSRWWRRRNDRLSR